MITYITDSDKFRYNLNSRDNTEVLYILYHSPWDIQSVKMLEYITENFCNTNHNFYIANIFDLPDSYSVMEPKRIPCLFILAEFVKEQYIPTMIWRTLDSLSKKKEKLYETNTGEL